MAANIHQNTDNAQTARKISEEIQAGIGEMEQASRIKLEALFPEIEKSGVLVQHLNKITQQNAAASIQMATGAEGLNVHAQELRALLALYKFGGVSDYLKKNEEGVLSSPPVETAENRKPMSLEPGKPLQVRTVPEKEKGLQELEMELAEYESF